MDSLRDANRRRLGLSARDNVRDFLGIGRAPDMKKIKGGPRRGVIVCSECGTVAVTTTAGRWICGGWCPN